MALTEQRPDDIAEEPAGNDAPVAPVGDFVAPKRRRDPRSALRNLVRELNPRVATGGAPVLPLLLLAGLDAVDGFDLAASSVLLPEIRDYFGVSITAIGTVQSITRFAALALAVPMGYLTDRCNRLWLIAIGALITGVMAVFTGFAWSFLVFVGFRFGAGLGRVVAPSEQALLADFYPTSVRASVFSFKQIANRLGAMAGPLLAGSLASLFFWQAPFLFLSIPAIGIAAVILFRLKEPARGMQERLEAGASQAVAEIAEAPPTWTESWRIAKNVRTMRRLWAALPFTVAAFQVSATLLPLFYEEEFGLGPAGRGAIAAIDEPVAIAGLLFGGAVANRFMRTRPSRVVSYLGIVSMVSALASALVVLAPNLFFAVAVLQLRAFAFAAFLPTLAALTTLVIPPRVRGFALSASLMFIAPGILAGPFLFALADAWGVKAGLLAMTPIYLFGAVLLMGTGPSVESDMRAARAAAMAGHVARQSRDAGEAKLLVVNDLDVHYGQVQILFNVDFEVTEGEIVALLGTNGAGKSTLLRAISGLTPASNGAIVFDAEEITFLPPSAHAAKGIIQVPGGKGVFPQLTVRENLTLAAWLFRAETDYTRTATENVLDRFPRLRERLDEPAGNLSGGEQQMLTLGQAFLSKPRLLMIDELSLGLAPAVVEQLLAIVRDIHASGTTVIVVEQSVNVALSIAERAVFMEKGEVKFSGSTSELMARPDIVHSVYLKGAGGGSVRARARQLPTAASEHPALEVRGITKTFGGIRAVDDVDLTLRDGQIVGLIGPNGAGKTTIFDLISGFVPLDAGSVRIRGEDLTDAAPDERANAGLARSFQDARLFPSLTVTENIAVALERHVASKSTIGAALHLPGVRKAERSLDKRIDRLIRLMGLGEFRDKFVKELSTGSRRIVDLACVMACDPSVLLLDEPSAGIAQREAEELGPVLSRIQWETGASILIIDHDMPLLTGVCDELVALELGAVIATGKPAEVLEHPRVLTAYLGTSAAAVNRSGALSAKVTEST